MIHLLPLMNIIQHNNLAMLPPFSVFMNFYPKLSGSRSDLISGLELLLHWHTTDTLQWSDTSLRGQHSSLLGHNPTHQEQGQGNIRHVDILSHNTFYIRVIFYVFYKAIHMPDGILISFALCSLWLVTVVLQRSTSCVLKKQQLCSKDANFDAWIHDARKTRIFFQKKMLVSYSLELILWYKELSLTTKDSL